MTQPPPAQTKHQLIYHAPAGIGKSTIGLTRVAKPPPGHTLIELQRISDAKTAKNFGGVGGSCSGGGEGNNTIELDDGAGRKLRLSLTPGSGTVIIQQNNRGRKSPKLLAQNLTYGGGDSSSEEEDSPVVVQAGSVSVQQGAAAQVPPEVTAAAQVTGAAGGVVNMRSSNGGPKAPQQKQVKVVDAGLVPPGQGPRVGGVYENNWRRADPRQEPFVPSEGGSFNADGANL